MQETIGKASQDCQKARLVYLFCDSCRVIDLPLIRHSANKIGNPVQDVYLLSIMKRSQTFLHVQLSDHDTMIDAGADRVRLHPDRGRGH